MAGAVTAETLGSIVGPQNVVADAERLPAYRFGGRVPWAAVRPGSGQEIAEIVRLAATERLILAPTAARTKLAMNIPVREYDVAVDMTRLDRVVAYDPQDLTLSVEAGLGLRKLAGVLNDHRQFLPLAVPFENRATVGGTIASGTDSPLRQLYGTARDYVLGMEFVTGEGQLAKSGGRVVKNVSGYDLHKLMIGSFGSLGVITRINFRTFPVCGSVRTVIASFGSVRDAVEMRHCIAQSPLRPLTLEILSPGAAQLLSRGAIPALAHRQWAVLVTFAGSEKVLERYERDLRDLAGDSEAALLDERDASAALALVREFVPMALESSLETAIVKMSVLPGQMARTVDDMVNLAEKEELRWAALARGVGVIYFALWPAAGDLEACSRALRVMDGLFEVSQHRGGNFAVPWLPEEWMQRMAPRKSGRSDVEQMHSLKRAFDPKGIFAPDPLAVWT